MSGARKKSTTNGTHMTSTVIDGGAAVLRVLPCARRLRRLGGSEAGVLRNLPAREAF